MATEERLQILNMIASGKITAQQGIDLLTALEDEEDLPSALTTGEVQSSEEPQQLQVETVRLEPIPPAAEAVSESPTQETASETYEPSNSQAELTGFESLPESPPFDPRSNKWRRWWQIPLWIGVIATILTGILMFSIYNTSGFGFWFACSWFPFLISVAIVALAWASRSAHWVHIRIHQRPGERPQKIAISFPIPLTLMAWFLRTFRNKIPNMAGVNPDEMILTLNHVTPEKPFYVEVNEDNGEHVEVYIG